MKVKAIICMLRIYSYFGIYFTLWLPSLVNASLADSGERFIQADSEMAFILLNGIVRAGLELEGFEMFTPTGGDIYLMV
jgi:hypothetical protein